MNKVIIAEDEFLIRIGIESSLPWNDLNMEIVASVADGEQAWRSYLKYKPEVLITDIRMPVLDGIKLIKRIRNIDRKCRIIVITCIEYFDMMYSSLELDITGYLLKSSMTQESMFRILSRLQAELNSGDDAQKSSSAKTNSMVDQLRLFLIERSLSAQQFLSNSTVPYNPQAQYCLCLLKCGRTNSMIQASLVSILKERFNLIHEIQIIQSGDYLYIMLCSIDAITVENITAILDNIQIYIRDFFDTELRAIIALRQSLANLPAAAEICETVISNPYFYPAKYTVIQSNVPASSALKIIEAFRNDPACFAFFQGNEKCVYKSTIDGIRTAFGKNRSAFIEAVESLRRYILHILPAVSPEELIKLNFNDYDDANALMQAFWNACPHYTYHPSYSTGILKSIETIHKDYHHEISLSDLAASMNIASHYYAILFKKTTGFGFSDFLLNIRLYHAADELRNSSTSISAISDNCGFSDAAYFSHCFKRVFQATPREYRKKKV